MIYPVDLNALYRFKDSATGELSKPIRWPRRDGMEIKGLDSNLKPLKVTEAEKPAFDSETQKLVVSEVEVEEEIQTQYTVVALDSAELQDKVDEKAVRDESIAVRKLIREIRNPGDKTVRQQVLTLNRAVAHLLKLTLDA